MPVHILLGLIAWDSWRLREFLGPNANVASARRIAQELIADEKENAQEEESEESQQSLPSLLIPFSSEASDIFKGIAEVSKHQLSNKLWSFQQHDRALTSCLAQAVHHLDQAGISKLH